MGRQERIEAFRKRCAEMLTEHICLSCADEFLGPSSRICLTSYPIAEVLECPKCGTEHYLLYDKVLCTAEDFDNRIRNNYGLAPW